MKRVKILGLFIGLLMLLGAKYEKREHHGLVLRVIDGDTFIFQVNKNSKKMRIRIYAIDAPEFKQQNSLGLNIGFQSTQMLKKLIENKKVKIKIIKMGFYGRPIAKVFYKDEDIGLKMIEKGFALTSYFYDYDSRVMKIMYESKMSIAMMKRIGIWKEGSFYRPDVYRKLARNKSLRGI